uniref:3-beta hydroxysteroid dehydrogenase/isomerase domain-containing protein n=1 Tax=Lactuca sativa TaxID=4236 RepID=A0A9R1VFJ4_LACSA|nr:hypothetical protein LSAT_V11C500264400 [Lactuca sativa]
MQLVKGQNWFSIWLHLIPPLITTSCIIQSMLKVKRKIINKVSTKNIIDACTKLNVKRLIHTSSPSVVFDGIHEIHNGEESLP